MKILEVIQLGINGAVYPGEETISVNLDDARQIVIERGIININEAGFFTGEFIFIFANKWRGLAVVSKGTIFKMGTFFEMRFEVEYFNELKSENVILSGSVTKHKRSGLLGEWVGFYKDKNSEGGPVILFTSSFVSPLNSDIKGVSGWTRVKRESRLSFCREFVA